MEQNNRTAPSLTKATAPSTPTKSFAPQQPTANKPAQTASNIDREVLISIKNLHKAYGKKQVLKGLNLEVYKGELFGFLGRNGIGKSTTIDCVIGSKKFEQGEIKVNGYNVLKEAMAAKQSFGYVASEPTCYEVMTGYDYLEFVASVYQLSEKEFVSGRNYLAERLAFKREDFSVPVANYSHGMKQKICLIASLLHNPPVWILDEPTVGLDIMAVEELKKMMREYANHGKTVMITSHNIELVAKLCDRVAIINDGVVAELLDLNKNPNLRLRLTKIFLDTYGGK
ncbi:MAG: ABC transporter ATP-binding protein [Clostridiales bacterium]|nr:ABC transporter ATP-binding protein [Clostridiales bacterium]